MDKPRAGVENPAVRTNGDVTRAAPTGNERHPLGPRGRHAMNQTQTLAPGSIRAICRVTYRMTDQMGVVYYGNYLELFEMGRGELMRAAGLDYRHMEADGFLLPCVHASLDYLSSARYDDLLEIDTRIIEMSRAKVHFAYEIRRLEEPKVLARGVTHHVFISREGKLRRLTPEWMTRLKKLSDLAQPVGAEVPAAG